MKFEAEFQQLNAYCADVIADRDSLRLEVARLKNIQVTEAGLWAEQHQMQHTVNMRQAKEIGRLKEHSDLITALYELEKGISYKFADEVERLKDALKWYADEHHWQAIHKDGGTLAIHDAGEIARKALEGL